MACIVDNTPLTAMFRNKWDHETGLSQWTDHCRSVSQYSPHETANAFERLGYEYLPVLSKSEAHDILLKVKSYQEKEQCKTISPYMESIVPDDDALHASVLEKVFNPDVDERIKSYFESEYLVWSMVFTCTSPFTERDYSFLWHRDVSPTYQLKILLYLNGSEEHNSSTSCLSVQDTFALANAGYSWMPVDERRDDLSEVCAKANVENPAAIRPVEAGEAVLFTPSECLHRGRTPASGSRYMLALNILPSNKHWLKSLEDWPIYIAQQCHGSMYDTAFTKALLGEVKYTRNNA
jgi:hypothetical protein